LDRFRIEGPARLYGEITVSGAKNAGLPCLAATLLTAEPVRLTNLPDVRDIRTMQRLLRHMGVFAKSSGTEVEIQAREIGHGEAPYDLVKTMRASVLVLGPVLARSGHVRVSLPGGCAIGVRPIDLHLAAFQKLGAEVSIEHGYVEARAGKLVGAEIPFESVTVTGTENAMLAATLARGTTRLLNAAREPEVADLAVLLRAMGARIAGEGTSTIEIEGVAALHGASHAVVADRIEAGTYAIAAAITGGHLEILGAHLEHLGSVGAVLESAGVQIWPTDRGLMVVRSGPLQGIDITTEPYPGFPTDLQAQFMALMTIASGASAIRETIYESRFMHVPELNRLGANISLQGSTALVRGVEKLHGAEVMATDLRASVSLVLAALVAEGETTVHRIYHLDRGYEALDRKLVQCGADIRRVAE
jgi:UDP-N-acetylglucosamine 1-carboxyvinyltransferase